MQYLFQMSGITIQNSGLFTNFLWNVGDDASNEVTTTTNRNELGLRGDCAETYHQTQLAALLSVYIRGVSAQSKDWWRSL